MAGQGHLGKKENLDSLPARLLDHCQVVGDIARNVAEVARNLCRGYAKYLLSSAH